MPSKLWSAAATFAVAALLTFPCEGRAQACFPAGCQNSSSVAGYQASVTNTSTSTGSGAIYASSASFTGYGLLGNNATGVAVGGQTTSGRAVYGSASTGVGVFGIALASSASNGVEGHTYSSTSSGVYGVNDGLTTGFGVAGVMAGTSNTGTGVYGGNSSTGTAAYAGYFNAPNGAWAVYGVGPARFSGTVSAPNLPSPTSTTLDVKSCCGAIGGAGTVNDLPAIQTAISKLTALGGGTLLFPSGRYRIDGTLELATDNITLEGAGLAASIIVASFSAGPVIHVSRAAPALPAGRNAIRRLGVDRSQAPSNSTAIGIHVERTDNTLVDLVSVTNSRTGIAVGVVGGSCAVDCNFGTVLNGVDIRPSGAASSQPADSAIAIYSSSDGRVDRAYVVSPSTAVGIAMKDNSNGWVVSESMVLFGAYGITSENNGFARYIVHSFIEGQTGGGQAVYIGGTSRDVAVLNTWIGNGAGCPSGSTYMMGVLIDSGTSYVQIHNSRIGQQCSSGVLSFGSYITINGNRLDGNAMNLVAADSIQLGGGRDVSVTDNFVFSTFDRCSIGAYSPVTRCIITSNNATASSGSGVCDSCAGPKVVTNNL